MKIVSHHNLLFQTDSLHRRLKQDVPWNNKTSSQNLDNLVSRKPLKILILYQNFCSWHRVFFRFDDYWWEFSLTWYQRILNRSYWLKKKKQNRIYILLYVLLWNDLSANNNRICYFFTICFYSNLVRKKNVVSLFEQCPDGSLSRVFFSNHLAKKMWRLLLWLINSDVMIDVRVKDIFLDALCVYRLMKINNQFLVCFNEILFQLSQHMNFKETFWEV